MKKKEQSNRVRTRGVYVVWLEINQSSYMGDVGEKMDQYAPTISIYLSHEQILMSSYIVKLVHDESDKKYPLITYSNKNIHQKNTTLIRSRSMETIRVLKMLARTKKI